MLNLFSKVQPCVNKEERYKMLSLGLSQGPFVWWSLHAESENNGFLLKDIRDDVQVLGWDRIPFFSCPVIENCAMLSSSESKHSLYANIHSCPEISHQLDSRESLWQSASADTSWDTRLVRNEQDDAEHLKCSLLYLNLCSKYVELESVAIKLSEDKGDVLLIIRSILQL